MAPLPLPLPAGAIDPRDNRLFALLPAEELALLAPRLRPVELPRRTVLQEPNRPIAEVQFLVSGLGSQLSDTTEDDAMEIGIVGREGVVGVHGALGVDISPHKVFMQIGGRGLVIAPEVLREVMATAPALTSVLLRYTSTALAEMGQLGACNGRHGLPERLARWLLMNQDRIGGDDLPVTHEFLGLMLGVRRAGVTVALGVLARAGIIAPYRGGLRVLNRRRLERSACACYGIARLAYERNLGPYARDPVGPGEVPEADAPRD